MTQKQTKALKIGAAVVLLATAGWFGWRNWGAGDARFKSTMKLVCVSTGKVYPKPNTAAMMLPAENPDTKQATLLPCEERADGVYLIPKYSSSLKRLGELNKVVDPQSLKVKTQG